MLNLVEGERCLVESTDSSFSPYEVHYAETFIVPAATVRSWSCRLISACLDRAEQNAEMRKTAGLTDAAARGLPVRPDISRRRRDTDSVQDCPGLPAGFSVGTG